MILETESSQEWQKGKSQDSYRIDSKWIELYAESGFKFWLVQWHHWDEHAFATCSTCMLNFMIQPWRKDKIFIWKSPLRKEWILRKIKAVTKPMQAVVDFQELLAVLSMLYVY